MSAGDGASKRKLEASGQEGALALTDDDDAGHVQVTSGDGGSTLTMKGDETTLQVNSKLVLSAADVAIEAGNSLALKGVTINVESQGPLEAKGQPIMLN